MVVKIFVGNLHVESTPANEAALRRQFEQFGRVVECDILTGKSFGFVHMENDDEANTAISCLNGEPLFGSPMNVELSANQNKGKKPPGAGRGGARGGGRGGRRDDRGHDGRFGDRGPRGRGIGGARARFDPYARNGADTYGRDPYYERSLRDLYEEDALYARARLARERELYGRDPYARAAYGRDPYARDPYARSPYESALAEDDAFARPPPEYYGRKLPREGPEAGRGLVSYPLPKSSGYGSASSRSTAQDDLFEPKVQPTMYGRPQTTSLYTGFE